MLVELVEESKTVSQGNIERRGMDVDGGKAGRHIEKTGS